MNYRIKKRGQSEVVSTVLLILIVVVAAMVLMSFVVPFIKKQLSGTECLDVMNKVEIKNNVKFTCYDATNPADKKMRVQIHVGDTGELLKGFQLNLEVGGSSESYEITPDATGLTGIAMYKITGAVVDASCTDISECDAGEDCVKGFCQLILDEEIPTDTEVPAGVKLEIPKKESEKTYVITVSGKPDSVSVYPILQSGKTCGASDTLTTINPCSI